MLRSAAYLQGEDDGFRHGAHADLDYRLRGVLAINTSTRLDQFPIKLVRVFGPPARRCAVLARPCGLMQGLESDLSLCQGLD